MKVTPLEAPVGAEISDIDVRSLDDDDVAALAGAWAEHGVLFLRDQDITPDEHIAFAERFADIDVNKFFTPVASHPRIAQVLKEADQVKNIGGGWHTDHSYDQVPARGSILLAREVPPNGGDTKFLSVGAAFDALADLVELPAAVRSILAIKVEGFEGDLETHGVGSALQRALCSMQAHHGNEHAFGANAEHRKEMEGRFNNPDLVGNAVHPVVIAHPDTGRALLYVNPAFMTHFVGWTLEESEPLRDFLLDFVRDGEFGMQFSWEPGSIAMWDNRSTWHFALNDYDGHRRLMHRITLAGTELSAAGSV